MKNILRRIAKNIRDADIWVNKQFGGKKDETVSSRWGRYIEDKTRPARGWTARVVCRTFLLPIGILLDMSWKHCRKSVNEKYKSKK